MKYCKNATLADRLCRIEEAMRVVKRSSSMSTRGIVHAAVGRQKFSLARFEPGAQLKPFVDHYWVVRYNLSPRTSHTQTVLSYPNVHLAFEHDVQGRRALVYGIPRKPFVRELRGTGWVLGVRFRAGGFYPFWGKDVALLTGRTIDASSVFGPEIDKRLHEVLDAGDDEAMAAVAERALSERLPQVDARAELAARIVAKAMDDRTLTKVEELAEASGLSVRQLQRLFHQYVGVTPKWVIKRFRLQEAAERIEQDASVPLAELAAELGYFDQAHFIRAFKSVLGQSPATYRKRGQG